MQTTILPAQYPTLEARPQREQKLQIAVKLTIRVVSNYPNRSIRKYYANLYVSNSEHILTEHSVLNLIQTTPPSINLKNIDYAIIYKILGKQFR